MSNPHPHFTKLLTLINRRLRELGTPHASEQIRDYPWLYGALGDPSAEVMFICENPSLAGVKKAHVATVDDNPPDIEAQWWGGPNDFAAQRLRPMLCEFGLKEGGTWSKGGWRCYITNVVKELNMVKDQNAKAGCDKREQARNWADILAWEHAQVNPAVVFCVGGKTEAAVKRLQREHLLPKFQTHRIWHYSARGSHEKVRKKMNEGIRAVLNTVATKRT